MIRLLVVSIFLLSLLQSGCKFGPSMNGGTVDNSLDPPVEPPPEPGADKQPPRLTIDFEPEVKQQIIDLTGAAEDDSGIKEVKIEWSGITQYAQFASATHGWRAEKISLEPGVNKISIQAKDQSESENAVTQTIYIYYRVETQPPGPEAPSVMTLSASDILENAATLHADVNPKSLLSQVYFQYGPSTAYSSVTLPVSAGQGASSVPVEVTVASLNCGASYHFRAVAMNEAGADFGEDLSFQTAACPPQATAPTISAVTANSITTNGANFNATVNPNLAATTAKFEYGLTTAYGTATQVTSIPLGSSAVSVGNAVSGLTCGTTYHYRAVAQNSVSTTASTDQTFQTAACPVVALPNSCLDSANSTDYQNCWNEVNTACVYVADASTNVVDSGKVYCGTNALGSSCRYKGTNLKCTIGSPNPVQEAVFEVSDRNQAAQSLKYQAVLEPGSHKVKRDGFVNNHGAYARPHFFHGERFAVQIPSYTKIRGVTLVDSATSQTIFKSKFFITNSVYDSLSINDQGTAPFCNDPSWIYYYRGACVSNLFTLTNVVDKDAIISLWGGSNFPGGVYPGNQSYTLPNPNALPIVPDKLFATTDYSKRLYEMSQANPVDYVDIQKIYFLGVEDNDTEELAQVVDEGKKAQILQDPWYFPCDSDACYYKYTADTGIRAKKLTGGHINISSNRFKRFWAFIMAGSFFYDLEDPYGMPQNLKVEGTPSSYVKITNNQMSDGIGADSLIVWGSYVEIANNQISDGYNDNIGHENGITVYIDSQHILVHDNKISRFPQGIDLEGWTNPVSKTKDIQTAFTLWPTILEDIQVYNNTITDTVYCIIVQRTKGSRIENNTCQFQGSDYIRRKLERLVDRSNVIYNLPSTNNTAGNQNLFYDWNSASVGIAFFLRANEYTVFKDNKILQWPRSFFAEILNEPPYNAGAFLGDFRNTFINNQTQLNSTNNSYFTSLWQEREQTLASMNRTATVAGMDVLSMYYLRKIQAAPLHHNTYCSSNTFYSSARYKGDTANLYKASNQNQVDVQCR